MPLGEVFAISNLSWLIYIANVAVAGLLISAATLVAELLARREPLPLRHALLATGLVLLLAAPLVLGTLRLAGIAPLNLAHWQPRPEGLTAPPELPESMAAIAPRPQKQAASARPRGSSPGADADRPSSGQAGPVSLAAERALAPPTEPATARPWLVMLAEALAFVWLLGCLVELATLVRGLVSVQRLLRSARPVAEQRIVKLAERAARQLGMRHVPRIYQSNEVDAPLSSGVLRSCIVLPAGQLHWWSDDAWHALLVHELAHVRRGDLPLGLVQRLAVALYWWNPLVRIQSSRTGTLREQICDDLVTKHSTRECGYAAVLVELAGRVAQPVPAPAALGALDGGSTALAERVRRLLNEERVLVTSLNLRHNLVVAGYCTALLVGISCTTARWATAAEPEPGGKTQPSGIADKALNVLNEVQHNDGFQKRIRVVDLEGEPIAGATVRVWAFRSAQGHGLWVKDAKSRPDPPTVTTDTEGRATIPFPRYGNPIEKIPMDALTCSVLHPDFAATYYNDVDVRPEALNEEAEIRLAPGGRITIAPRAEGTALDTNRLFVLWSSPAETFPVRVTSEGKLELPRLPAGEELLRVVYLPEEGPTRFSRVLPQTLQDGKSVEIEAELLPSVVVAGKLDDRVPRPVANGVIIAAVIEATSDAHNTLDWRVAADIEPDGTFQIHDVPQDCQLQVTALCDGYMATSGDAPDFVPEQQRKASKSFSTPQVFHIGEEAADITLAMTPTVECLVNVVDQAGRPIEDAKVFFGPNVKWWNGGSQIYCHPRYSSTEILLKPDSDVIRERRLQASPFHAFTNAGGTARVKNLPPRSLTFVVGAEGYEMPIEGNNRMRRVDLRVGERHDLTVMLQPRSERRLGDLPQALLDACLIVGKSGTRIIKPAPPVRADVSSEPTELAGLVVDEAGEPLADVQVDVWTSQPGTETKTDAEGRFRIANFQPHEPVEVEFSKRGYCPSLFVEQAAGTQNWVILLTQGTGVAGRVLDPAGNPVPGARVRAGRGPFVNNNRRIEQVWTETTADDQGRYRLDLENGIYAIEVQVAQVGALRVPDVLVASKTMQQLDLKLELAAAGEKSKP